jgi:hypothetical protein
VAVSQISLGFPTGTKLFADTDSGNAAVVVIASAATLYECEFDNSLNAAQDVYIKMFNSAGAVVIGTTVPDYVFEIPQGVKRSVVMPDGFGFTLGIQVACVTAGGTAGTTSPTSDVTAKLVYA